MIDEKMIIPLAFEIWKIEIKNVGEWMGKKYFFVIKDVEY